VTAADPVPELEDQRERTLLAWRRTALSLAAAGILAGHFATDPAGPVPVFLAFVLLAAAVGYAWLAPGARTATAGASLVAGVLVLGVLALVSVL
jgi:putative membrane protein